MTPEIVNQNVFYRIEHASTKWEAGNVVEVGCQDNPFTINWKNEETRISRPDSVPEKWVNLELERLYKAVIGPNYDKRRLELLDGLPNALARILKAINDSVLASRELAFEIVRRNHFSELPSRMQCMFLIPDDIDCIKYWWNELKTQGGGNRRLFRVTLSGTIHRASAGQLIPLRTCSFNSWCELARNYWEPKSSYSADCEVLAYGTVTFLKELAPLDFGCLG